MVPDSEIIPPPVAVAGRVWNTVAQAERRQSADTAVQIGVPAGPRRRTGKAAALRKHDPVLAAQLSLAAYRLSPTDQTKS
ncbi:hypothetical protein AB0K48_25140, partial [Nonomuraea sp. NPDC055795]